jgi:hypothetical protein
VIRNLIDNPIDLRIIIESLSTTIEINLLKISRYFVALKYKVGKISLHKRGLTYYPLSSMWIYTCATHRKNRRLAGRSEQGGRSCSCEVDLDRTSACRRRPGRAGAG